MKSEVLPVESVFKDRRQYCVPFYQRTYVWTMEDQWEQLWDDVCAKAEARLALHTPSPHFLGAVVLDPQVREGLRGVDVLHIIDGQQRLTTLQFVLASLVLAMNLVGQSEFENAVAPCLWNGNPDTMRDPKLEVFKVWPTFRDRQSYQLALQATGRDELRTLFPESFTQAGGLRKIGIRHPAALEAIWYFTNSMEEWISAEPELVANRAEALVLAILKDLKVVAIFLEGDDDAQIIFETLNGRGAQLHATDLIRNYVFMRADRDGEDSESLYSRLWVPFEADYWVEEQRRGRIRKPKLEWLIHTSLQAELHEEVDLSRLYTEYRRFATSGSPPPSAERQLRTLTEYAKHYTELVNGSGDMPIARFGSRIAPYDVTTLYPLALLISTSNVSNDAKREMFDDLLSYLVRRAICGLTHKNYNNVFIGALRQLHSASIAPSALRGILGVLTGEASRWPTDAEFRVACLKAELLPGRIDTTRIRAVLTELEGYLRKQVSTEEPVAPDLASLDVDHIMPRSWYDHWPLPDGSTSTYQEARQAHEINLLALLDGGPDERTQQILDRESAIPTLGNLTLLHLSVNRSAQHQAFAVKRDQLIANTSLRLNVPLISLQRWDEDAIAERGEELADAALKNWPGPRP